jgi:tetratricopeptide (TPR) repeat protein
LGPNNGTTLFAVYNLGLLLGIAGRGEEAGPYLKRAAEGYEQLEGPEGPYTIESISLLGHNYMERGMLNEAGPLLERAYEVRHRTLVANHPLTLASVVRLGIYYDRTADAPEAARMWLVAHENFEKLPDWVKAAGLDHWAQIRVGSIRIAEMKYDEAKRLLLEGYQGIREKISDRPTLRQTTDYLIWLYSAMGRSDEVAKWQAERAKYLPVTREVAPQPRAIK